MQKQEVVSLNAGRVQKIKLWMSSDETSKYLPDVIKSFVLICKVLCIHLFSLFILNDLQHCSISVHANVCVMFGFYWGCTGFWLQPKSVHFFKSSRHLTLAKILTRFQILVIFAKCHCFVLHFRQCLDGVGWLAGRKGIRPVKTE